MTKPDPSTYTYMATEWPLKMSLLASANIYKQKRVRCLGCVLLYADSASAYARGPRTGAAPAPGARASSAGTASRFSRKLRAQLRERYRSRISIQVQFREISRRSEGRRSRARGGIDAPALKRPNLHNGNVHSQVARKRFAKFRETFAKLRPP